MFLAAMRLRKTQPNVARGFRTPAMTLVGWVGFIASVLAFLIGFVEPTGTSFSQLAYAGFLVGGIVILGCGPFIFYALRKPGWNLNQQPAVVGKGAKVVAGAAAGANAKPASKPQSKGK